MNMTVMTELQAIASRKLIRPLTKHTNTLGETPICFISQHTKEYPSKIYYKYTYLWELPLSEEISFKESQSINYYDFYTDHKIDIFWKV